MANNLLVPEIATHVHGHQVLAWAQTEVQRGIPCGIIMCKIHKGDDKVEYVVAWYRQGDREWSTGDYKFTFESATEAFIERIRGNGYGLKER